MWSAGDIYYDRMVHPLISSPALSCSRRVAVQTKILRTHYVKTADWDNAAIRENVVWDVAGKLVAWRPLRYYMRLRAIALFCDSRHGIAVGFVPLLSRRSRSVNARGYVATALELDFKRLTRVKHIFDNATSGWTSAQMASFRSAMFSVSEEAKWFARRFCVAKGRL